MLVSHYHLPIWLAFRTRSAVLLSGILLLLWLSLVYPVAAFAGLGGYISEKMLGDGTGEALLLGDGVNDAVVLGSGPVVSTLVVTDTSSSGGTVSATLRGNIASLNGMPRADIWFTWGYGPSALSNTSSTSTVTASGNHTIVINDIDIGEGQTVYYQFHADTDGTSSGHILSFSAGGGHGASYWFMQTLLPILLAAAILVATLLLTGSPIVALLSAVIGLIGFYIIQAMVSML